MKHPIGLQLAPEDVYCPFCERNAWNEFVEAFYVAIANTNYIIVPPEVDLTCKQCYKDFVIKLNVEMEAAIVKFLDAGFCQDESTEGELHTRYFVPIETSIDAIRADAGQLEIEFMTKQMTGQSTNEEKS